MPSVTTTRRGVRIGLLAVAVLSLIAVTVSVVAPFGFSLLGAQVSVTHLHKPMTLALLALVGLLCTSPRVIHAWQTRSPAAFYLLAAVLMWLFSLGLGTANACLTSGPADVPSVAVAHADDAVALHDHAATLQQHVFVAKQRSDRCGRAPTAGQRTQ